MVFIICAASSMPSLCFSFVIYLHHDIFYGLDALTSLANVSTQILLSMHDIAVFINVRKSLHC